MFGRSWMLSRVSLRMAGTLAGALMFVAGLSGLGATPAAAQVTGSPAAATVVPGVSTDANCAAGSGTLVGVHDAQGKVECLLTTGTFPVVIPPPLTYMVLHSTNRVWLHQNLDSSGWADCFHTSSPPTRRDLHGRDTDPGNIQVSSNTAAC